MRVFDNLEPFGEASIPQLSSGELTASYRASDWARLSKSWGIRMYRTYPGSADSVELPTVTFAVRAEDHMPLDGIHS